MTHTSHPFGFRLGTSKTWRSQWFSNKKEFYVNTLKEDHLLRTFLDKHLENKMVSDCILERNKGDSLNILIKTAKPGLIIGRDGLGIEELLKKTKSFARKNKLNENINIRVEEVRYIEQNARLIAESVVESLKKQQHYRRVMKTMVEKVMANREIRGCRIVIAGRLAGAEIARREEAKLGNIPLQTIKADIDYANLKAVLPYGVLGIKVWIYKGEVSDK